jgi:drug/metabolite transporter (DMT)-like permease
MEAPAMDSGRRPVDASAMGLLVLLCALWGLQQVAIKAAAPDVAPVMQVALRSGLSAVLVAAWGRLRRQRLDLLGPTLRPGLVAGALFAAEFLFVAEGLRHTTASHMAVFLYTSPVFTALGLHFTLRAERLSRLRWLGVGMGFAGIALAFGGGIGAGGAGGAALFGDACGVLAGAAWGATTVVVRRSSLSEAPPAATLLYQLVVGFVVLLASAAASRQLGHVSLTPIAVSSLLFQGVVVSFASYLAWFWLLRRYLASRVSVFSFMTPLFGVTFGVLLLGEPVSPAFGGGALLVLAGITVVTGADLVRRAGFTSGSRPSPPAPG